LRERGLFRNRIQELEVRLLIRAAAPCELPVPFQRKYRLTRISAVDPVG